MGFCDLPLADKVCSVGDAASFVSDPGKTIGDWMAKSAGELAAASADLAAKAVDSTTEVDLNATWFRDNYEMLLPIGLTVLVATFCAQLVRAAVKRDGQALSQAFTGTMAGVLFAFCAVALTSVALAVVDALSDGLFQASHLNIQTAVRRMIQVNQISVVSQLGWLVAVVAGLAASVGAVLYWCVMVARKVGILVMVTLAVFAGAGGGWEVARRWRRGWVEATATLVVSKLLMTVVLVLGISAMGKTQAKDGVGALSDIMTGIVIMLLVLMCPYATFKFAHWAAEGTSGEDIHRAGGAGAHMARQHAEKATRKAAAMAATGGAGAAAGASPQGPDTATAATGGGGFPGDIAANPTGLSPDSGEGGLKAGMDKALQPPPTSTRDDTIGQVGGVPGPGGGSGSPTSGQGGGFMTLSALAPTTTPSPHSEGPPVTPGASGTRPPPTGG
ncbi:SCO6881 family protein [Actinacidiphila sp. bgisy144]|uniref:SCO6881 family protein n=1 Tax=Actinacidiphila sp. bgisy144 TaxID=3413791 RepID=UPI003EC0F2ED